MRHIPPLIIMMISGIIGIRLALSPVAVTGTTCTKDHPYYLSNCDEPNWTATPVTVYPTASENDMPDTDPPIQIPTQNATQIAELTATVTSVNPITQSTAVRPATSNNPPLTVTMTPTFAPTMTSTATRTRINTSIIQEQVIDEKDSVMICQQQARFIIKGTTEPYSLLLLTFADRVVGGGMSYASGGYAIPLIIGNEAGGMYQVELRQRNTNKVIKQFSCTVP